MNNTGGHLRPFRMLGTPPGTCPECAEIHDATQPHNQQSLAYQYKFYDQHGRWPTWSDAMEHCSDTVKEYWIKALQEAGIDVGTTIPGGKPMEDEQEPSHGGS